LGVADYGRLALLTLLVSLATTLTNAGVSEAVMQWGAAAFARGDDAQVNMLLRRSLGYHLLVQLPLMVITVVVLARGQSWLVLVSLVLSVMLPAALGSASLSNSIENRAAGAAQVAMVTNLVVQLAISVTAFVYHDSVEVWTARSLAGSLLLPLNFMIMNRSRRRVGVTMLPPTSLPRGFWRFALVTLAGSLAGMLVFSRSELLILGHFGTTETVGLFALAFGLSQQISAPIDALMGPLKPAVAGIAEAHPTAARQTLLRISRVSSLVAAGVSVFLVPIVVVAMPLLYGSDYEESASPFAVLALVSCLQSAASPLGSFTTARRRPSLLLRLNLQALVVDILVALALIPVFGLWGAVAANVAGQLAVVVPLVVVECRVWGVPVRDCLRAFSLALAATPVMVACMLAVHTDRANPFVWALIGCLTASASVVGVANLAGAKVPTADLAPMLAVLPQSVRRLAAVLLRPLAQKEIVLQ
jgi:O-antigen/teichoic acid export membrane protein